MLLLYMQVKKVETIAKYIHIAGKLQRTIILHFDQYPALKELQNAILTIPIDKTQANPFLHHLEKVAHVLQSESSHYVVRHLHHYFTKDVEALRQGWELADTDYYLQKVNNKSK